MEGGGGDHIGPYGRAGRERGGGGDKGRSRKRRRRRKRGKSRRMGRRRKSGKRRKSGRKRGSRRMKWEGKGGGWGEEKKVKVGRQWEDNHNDLRTMVSVPTGEHPPLSFFLPPGRDLGHGPWRTSGQLKSQT